MSKPADHLPSGWAYVPIEKLLEALDDGRTLHHGWSPQCDAEPADDGQWGVLKTTAVQDGVFLSEHNKRLPAKLKPRTQFEVRPGDILLTCAGPRVRCGVACLVRATRDRLILSGKMYRFRVHPESMDGGYMEAFLRAPEAQRLIDKMKTGISDSGLNLTHGRFFTLRVPVAPLPEQRRIVAKIEELFSDLDAGVAALERVKANLKRYRAAVLKAAVEGRLTEEWRKHNPPTETGEQLLKRILAERRAKWEAEQLRKFAEKGKEPGKGWREKYKPAEVAVRISRDIPIGWAPGTIDQVSWLDVGFAFKSDKFTNDGVRLLRGENIEPGALRWKETRCWPTDQVAEFEHLMVHEGDIILAMDRPIVSAGLKVCRAKAHDIPCLLVQRVARFKPIDAKFTAFLYLAVQTRDFIRHVLAGQTGTQLPHISGQGIATFSFAIPPLAEQAEIVAEVDRRLSVADAAEKQVEAALQRTSRLRQAILKRAFEGKLVPQDPADEPVERLVERACARVAAEMVTSTKATTRKRGKGKANQ
jgi:type I restriction enzyme S subunit